MGLKEENFLVSRANPLGSLFDQPKDTKCRQARRALLATVPPTLSAPLPYAQRSSLLLCRIPCYGVCTTTVRRLPSKVQALYEQNKILPQFPALGSAPTTIPAITKDGSHHRPAVTSYHGRGDRLGVGGAVCVELATHVPPVVAYFGAGGSWARGRGDGADRLHRVHPRVQENPQPKGRTSRSCSPSFYYYYCCAVLLLTVVVVLR